MPNYITYYAQRFYDRLRDHLISRCTARDFDGDEYEYLPIERNAIRIKNDELREYNTLQVNYTTYDGRRGQEYFNPVLPVTLLNNLGEWPGEVLNTMVEGPGGGISFERAFA